MSVLRPNMPMEPPTGGQLAARSAMALARRLMGQSLACASPPGLHRREHCQGGGEDVGGEQGKRDDPLTLALSPVRRGEGVF